ncbi:MAG: hypothetical protein HOI47_34005 [Candidatus Scalindua sp.]|jgi:hypothetical protein|nr:hypothetical protein [Candidatus Scalindua sp.]MBT6231684.1 hypothetical protein [Candidatus Scalindua sp.]
MNKTIIVLTLSILLFSCSLYAEDKNYCNDPGTNMQWETMAQEHPDDLQIHALHAIRLGLCFKVDRGDLTVDQATEIFENMRSALIDAKVRDMENGLEDDKNERGL